MNREASCMTVWLPAVEKSGVPYPKTIIVKTEVELLRLCDGTKPEGFDAFLDQVKLAGREVGFPCFLRTGLTSGKHDWKRTCYVESPDDIAARVGAIVEFSACCDLMGLPTNVWAVREFLADTAAAFIAFNGMPVTKERRYFVKDGKVRCHHPYWPAWCIHRPSVDGWQQMLAQLNQEDEAEIAELTRMAEAVGGIVGGEWSIDFLWTKSRGWVCIDMAQADASFHWVSCPNCPEEMRAQYAEQAESWEA